MVRRFKAVISGDALLPETDLALPDGSVVELILDSVVVEPPEVTDEAERQRIIAGVVERMPRHPFSPDARIPTREELHERRWHQCADLHA